MQDAFWNEGAIRLIGLITDRSQANVDRLKELSAKGWNNMTAAEKAEWTGDPLLSSGGANLIPRGENYAPGVSIQYHSESTVVTSNWDGTYIYGIVLIGPAANYAGKTMTLSLDSFYSSGGGVPNIVLYWHDANGAEYAGGGLTDAGSITFTLTENTAGRENLALYLYATTDTAITAGAFVRYDRLMLEMGDVRHDYVPYYAVLPTMATKGAYNYSDLNRVEGAVREIAEKAGVLLTTKTNWTAWDIPKQSDMNRVLRNIEALRSQFPIAVGMPETPQTMSRLNYSAANNIERIVGALADAVNRAIRSGDVYAGEV